MTVWPIEADTYEEAAEGGWPCGYIHKVKRYGSIALFSAYLGAEDVWREFEEDLQEDGFLKARRWLVRRVREALKSRDRSKPAKSESQ
ncbi:MAG: hypothetical protein Q8N84_01865 [bacterium]|nr:hypothetical protein [bacterium]